MASRAFFSRFTQGASAKTVCAIRQARSDTGEITEKCSNFMDQSPLRTYPSALQPHVRPPAQFLTLPSLHGAANRPQPDKAIQSINPKLNFFIFHIFINEPLPALPSAPDAPR